MKPFKRLMSAIIIVSSFTIYAQNSEVANRRSADKKSYYQKRAAEDAKFEQQFTAETKAEEEAFWKEQKAYEDDLKQKDRKAYRAYMKGKRDAYAEHYEHCNHYCHHSDYYYHHATFYYYGYHSYYYDRYPRRSTTSIGVRVHTPSVSLGLL